MREVPPQERNLESEQPDEGAPLRSPPETPPGDASQADTVEMPPFVPVREPSEERSDTALAPDARPRQFDAGAGEEQRSGEKASEVSPSERPGPPTHAPGGSQAPTVAEPAADTVPVSTTGVPHYPPPAATPQFPRGPAVEVTPGESGSGAATAAAPPVQRRSIFRTLGRGLREIAETVILALLIFLLVRAVVQNFQVEGGSMQPTLQTRWYLLVNKAIYWEINLKTVSKFLPFIDPGEDPTRYVFRGPRRGDVIVFKAPNQSPGSPERDFIKRVIAVPGEKVEIRDCTVFIDGEPLDEPYIKEKPTDTYGPETVPPGHYFVMGDNRNHSRDSRAFGMLPKENIIGQAWLTYWPFSAFGLVDNTSVEPGNGAPEGTAVAAEGKAAAACAS